jgi:HNH endonuclease/AP2 domain
MRHIPQTDGLTHDRLREVLDYDPDTGIFTWKIALSNVKSGAIAGTSDEEGYRYIGIDKKTYAAGRLAIFWMTGSWPQYDCDHEDGDPSNNRWVNLRDATITQNLQNKAIQSNNKCGLKGVFRHKNEDGSYGKWRAKIKANGKHFHLGLFDCPAAARFAYIIAADKHFGAFARSS